MDTNLPITSVENRTKKLESDSGQQEQNSDGEGNKTITSKETNISKIIAIKGCISKRIY